MTDEVRLSRVRTVLERLSYPVTTDEAQVQLDGTTVLFADGDEPISSVIARSSVERFDSVKELESELFSHLPVEAVGEPGQSEGDG